MKATDIRPLPIIDESDVTEARFNELLKVVQEQEKMIERLQRTEVVLICGSRTWTDRKAVERVIFDLDRDTIVVHGAARGADTLADAAALMWGLLRRPYPADWQAHGKAAGPRRNQRMLAENDIARVIAFRMPGESRGTDDMIRRAKAAGIPVEIVTPNE